MGGRAVQCGDCAAAAAAPAAVNLPASLISVSRPPHSYTGGELILTVFEKRLPDSIEKQVGTLHWVCAGQSPSAECGGTLPAAAAAAAYHGPYPPC